MNLDKQITHIVKETDINLFQELLQTTHLILDKVLHEAVHKNNYEIVKFALENGARPNCFGHKNFLFACVENNNTNMLMLLAKHKVPLQLNQILLARMIAKGAGVETMFFFQENGVDCIKDPWIILFYALNLNRRDLIFFLLKENSSQQFTFENFFDFLKNGVCRLDDVQILCHIHRFYRHIFTPENCQKIMNSCHGTNIPIFLATRFGVQPSPFHEHLHKVVFFAMSHFEKVKRRACRVIASRWIPICYDLSTERGQRMRDRNFEKLQDLYYST